MQPKSTKANLTSTGFKLFIKIQDSHKLKSISTGVKLALFVGSITLHPVLSTAILLLPATKNHVELVDYREIASHILFRSERSVEGVVRYRLFSFQIPAAVFTPLAHSVAATHISPHPDAIAQVSAWLNANLPPIREAWSGECRFHAANWLDVRSRMNDVDTSRFALQGRSVTTVPYSQLSNWTSVHSNCSVQTTIDQRLIVMKHRATTLHPLMALDITVAPWHDAIVLGTNVPGQEIRATQTSDVHTITYRNALSGGSWVETAYMFDANLDWGPRTIHTFNSTDTIGRTEYGYAPRTSGVLMRPSVVVRGDFRSDGDVDVSVTLVDEWVEACDPSTITLREPALFLELDYTGESADPVVTIRAPAYLDGVEPCSKPIVAIVQILETLGSSDPSTDYNYDGIVDGWDIDDALSKFSGAQ